MNFKEFKHVYIETCNKIIEEKGKCVNIECKDCPFSCDNQINGLDCVDNKYNDGNTIDCEQITLLNSAKEYLKLIKVENDMILNIKNHDPIWERKGKSESEIKLDEEIQKQIEKLNKSVEEFKNEIAKLIFKIGMPK